MRVFQSERFRYGLYAVSAGLAALAYVWLGSASEQLPIEASRKAVQNEELPVLLPLDTEVEQEARRDLFVFGSGPPVIETVMPEGGVTADQAESLPEKRSLLASVQALGLVRRNDTATILVRVGTQLVTVALGEPFGEGATLHVRSIEGRDVVIAESTTGDSRSFQLSEE